MRYVTITGPTIEIQTIMELRTLLKLILDGSRFRYYEKQPEIYTFVSALDLSPQSRLTFSAMHATFNHR